MKTLRQIAQTAKQMGYKGESAAQFAKTHPEKAKRLAALISENHQKLVSELSTCLKG